MDFPAIHEPVSLLDFHKNQVFHSVIEYVVYSILCIQRLESPPAPENQWGLQLLVLQLQLNTR